MPARYEQVSARSRVHHIAHGMANRGHIQVATHDDDDSGSPIAVPNSPPPSFRSRTSSPPRDVRRDSEQQRNLNDAFDAPSDDDSDDEAEPRDRRRLIQSEHTPSRTSSDEEYAITLGTPARPPPQRTVTEIPVFAPPTSSGRVVGGGTQVNDGVFSNISAKPRPGEELEEKPPTYEQAAADATPPYWETTVLSPYGTSGNPDDVFVTGLLVGSLFSFVWNALISMSFQLIGFLLTYLLHTTHAAKHGSRAGLGITLVQYGFQMRYAASQGPMDGAPGMNAPTEGVPDDPNAHVFDPNEVVSGGGGPGGMAHGISTADWLSYALMIIGWFILIRAVSDFMRARRQEQIIRSSPDRGLGVAVVADNETPETSV